jgi:hypothetical protein
MKSIRQFALTIRRTETLPRAGSPPAKHNKRFSDLCCVSNFSTMPAGTSPSRVRRRPSLTDPATTPTVERATERSMVGWSTVSSDTTRTADAAKCDSASARLASFKAQTNRAAMRLHSGLRPLPAALSVGHCRIQIKIKAGNEYTRGDHVGRPQHPL